MGSQVAIENSSMKILDEVDETLERSNFQHLKILEEVDETLERSNFHHKREQEKQKK